MRKRYRVLFFASIVAAVAVPVGFALSLESGPVVARIPAPASLVASTVVATPALIDTGRGYALSRGWSPSDPVKLLIVGTLFLGVAAVVRRNI
jgi:hypothetical protein